MHAAQLVLSWCLSACRKSGAMRNTGDGQWREWRWEGNVVPLYMPDPKQPKPATYKPLTEAAAWQQQQ
eukprot:858425-Amphidinium_carterae.1